MICRLTQDGIGIGWVEDLSTAGLLLGLIADGDLRRTLRDHSAKNWANLSAADLMTADPITVDADLLAVAAIKQMECNHRKPISVLPVVGPDSSGNLLLGLLRLHDLVQAGLT